MCLKYNHAENSNLTSVIVGNFLKIYTPFINPREESDDFTGSTFQNVILRIRFNTIAFGNFFCPLCCGTQFMTKKKMCNVINP